MKQKTPGMPKRRQLIKTLTGAGSAVVIARALPERWTTPVVDSVVLPVHALTSQPIANGDYSVTGITGSLVAEASPFLDRLVPSAYAGGINPTMPIVICMTVSNGLVTFLQVEFEQDNKVLFGMGLPKPVPGTITLDVSSATTLQSGFLQVNGPSGNGVSGIVSLTDTFPNTATYPFTVVPGGCPIV